MNETDITKFGWWIFGYQKFSEEIVRQCLVTRNQWKDITPDGWRVPAAKVIEERLPDLTDWPTKLREQAQKLLRQRKRRMTLDAAFIDEKDAGKTIIGEFKSWGGFDGRFESPKELKDCILEGGFCPDRLVIHKIESGADQDDCRSVTGFVIATNFRCQKTDDPASFGLAS